MTEGSEQAMWTTNAKGIVDGYHNLSMQVLGQLVNTQQQLFAASIDNVRNLQQAHADHVRNGNDFLSMTKGSIKTIEDKILDPDATEIAAQALSSAQGLGGLNSANKQVDSNVATALSQVGALISENTAIMRQVLAAMRAPTE